MYKTKSGEKKHRHLKMCFLTLAEWYLLAQEKKAPGRRGRVYKTNESSALALVWPARDACVFSECFHRPSQPWCRITPPGEALKLTVVLQKWEEFTPEPGAGTQNAATYCRTWAGLTMQMIMANTSTKTRKKSCSDSRQANHCLTIIYYFVTTHLKHTLASPASKYSPFTASLFLVNGERTPWPCWLTVDDERTLDLDCHFRMHQLSQHPGKF